MRFAYAEKRIFEFVGGKAEVELLKLTIIHLLKEMNIEKTKQFQKLLSEALSYINIGISVSV